MMEKVLLKYRAPLTDITGRNSDEIEAANVKDALKFIKAQYGSEAHKIAKRMVIAVNGKSVLLTDNLKTTLKSGDTVFFLPVSGGG